MSFGRLIVTLVWLVPCLALTAAPTQAAPTAAPPSDSQIREILAHRIDVEQQSVGIVVGVIDPTGAGSSSTATRSKAIADR
jgi:hypothetical protein